MNSPLSLQAHLYNSFLQGKVSDITLSVQGTWQAKYKLHRVVLIQAGFFCSLFTAGFAESASNGGTGLEEIDVVFDDRNITRAAFEICIARLYGGGPPLYVSPSFIPTPTQPLTPGWMATAPLIDLPPGHHPATPRFLLSLLATAVYLSIPSVASQALTLILGSIGPYTVMNYLNFALGKPINDLAYDEPVAALGLEEVTQNIPTVRIDGDKHQEARQIKGSSPCHSRYLHAVAEDHANEPLFLYGTISNKIGEAAACWLARWGPDILPLEVRSSEVALTRLQSTSSSLSCLTFSGLEQCTVEHPEIFGRKIPVIWARGGLSAKWINALISSDVLFVRGEHERYEFAKSVVELRRRDGIEEVEEREWERMFRQGIYYINMPTEDVIAISQEISLTTGRPYVPMAVLQSANWNQSVLRGRITSKSLVSGSQRDKELGITVTTADILTTVRHGSSNEKQEETVYYRVPTDSSTRLGENGKIEASTMEQLFEASSLAYNTKGSTAISSRSGTCEANFFGLQSEHPLALSCIDSDPTGASRWSPYPPFRFAVEFWGVHNLREKTPLHSQTIWYAGSFFNVYVQLVRKKGTQLGMYLHRQSSIDPLPVPSSPTQGLIRAERPQITTWTSEAYVSRAGISTPPSTPPSIRAGPSRSTSSLSHGGASPTTPAVTLQPSARVTPVQPYRDPRSSVSVYFSIACASATGVALTQFTSAPDVFTVGQSWGWKSSSLIAEGHGDVAADDVFGPEVSLRATVVLGVV